MPGKRIWALGVLGAGLLAMQISWVLALRPFAGIDEFAHVDRAASVARGQWFSDPTPAVHDTGSWATVPTNLVTAAHEECAALPYTSPSECRGTPQPNGTTLVATSAGRYNPLFYALIGYPSLLASGAGAVIVMRIVNLLSCWSVFILAVLSTRHWARTRWPSVGLVIAFTPVVLYSSAVAAPNALEIVAGIGLYSALLGLLAIEGAPPRSSLVTLAVSGIALATVRSLGPGWLLLIVATVVLAVPSSLIRIRQLLRLKAFRGVVVAIGTAVVAGLAWTIALHATALDSAGHHPLPLGEKLSLTAKQIPLWLLQSIAAFPYRDQPTLPVVYAVYLILGIGLVFLGIRAGRHLPRLQAAIWISVVVAGLLPAIATLRTIEDYGLAWQGRYTLPYTVGTLLLAAWALDRTSHRLTWRVLLPGVLLYAVGQTVSITHTYSEQLNSPLAHSAAGWLTLPAPVLASLASLGALATALGATLFEPHVLDEVEPANSDPKTCADAVVHLAAERSTS